MKDYSQSGRIAAILIVTKREQIEMGPTASITKEVLNRRVKMLFEFTCTAYSSVCCQGTPGLTSQDVHTSAACLMTLDRGESSLSGTVGPYHWGV